MRIDDDHLYHGAALIQIAEDPQFTAINSFKLAAGISRSAYRINDDTGVYLKYASKPSPAHREFSFSFQKQHLAQLAEIAKSTSKVFVALVCVKARHICCLAYEELMAMIDARKRAKGAVEDQYVVLVTMPINKGFRIYLNEPGVKNTMLGKPLIVSRNDFPNAIFR